MKFEWNCGNDADHNLYTKIIQFRPSGIRVKLPDCIPALNLVGTQIPIIPWVKIPDSISKDYTHKNGRYLSIREGAILQGMKDINFGELSYSRTWEALGNAVNATLVKRIAKNLLSL
jgi:DNA (cytosine-5)-methyltransferase 1